MKQDVSGGNPQESNFETSSEVRNSRQYYHETRDLTSYWDKRWHEHYSALLDEVPEYGRHGVIAEYINRLVQGGTVLDVGCGTGILAELLDRSRFGYVGVDISDVPLKVAQSHTNRNWGEYYHTRIEEYSPTTTFPAIVLGEVAYYLDLDAVYSRIVQWLCEPKMVIVSAFDFPTGLTTFREMCDRLHVLSELSLDNAIRNLRWRIAIGIAEPPS